MFNLGMGEITIILVLALIFIGPKKLPELASGLGKLIREIRKTTSDVKNEIQLDDAIRKPFEELRDAVTLHPDELKRRDRLRRDVEELRKKMEADAAVMAANASQSPEEAPLPDGGQALVEGEPTDVSAQTAEGTPAAESTPGIPTGFFQDHSASHDHHEGYDHSESHDHPASAEMPSAAPPPPAVPSVPGAAPAGTVARTPSAAHAAPAVPPAPPLAAVLAKGPAPVTPPDRRAVQPPSGSDFVRSLRAASEGKRSPPVNPGQFGPDPNSAADRGNTTQALTEADLAAITVGPPPPPPGQSATRNLPPSAPPGLPGATPRKNPT